MEVLFLLLPLALVAAAFGGGSDDDGDDSGTERPPENDIIEGDDDPQELSGQEGNDLIFGDEGGDTIDGGEGFDIIGGESGNDALSGQSENDLLMGGSGNDTLDGDEGNDALVGGAGNDRLVGAAGDDDMLGMSGADTLEGGDGNDLLLGLDVRDGQPATEIVGTIGSDLALELASQFGSEGTDQLARAERSLLSSNTDTSPDELYGGDGDDDLVGDLGDTLTGGEGTDFFDYVGNPGDAPITITDFDVANEVLFVTYFGPPLVDVTVTDGPGGAEVRLDGEVVTVLTGVAAADVPMDNIRLTG